MTFFALQVMQRASPITFLVMTTILVFSGPFELNGQNAADKTCRIRRCILPPCSTGLSTDYKLLGQTGA